MAITMIAHMVFKNMGMYSPQVNIVKKKSFEIQLLEHQEEHQQ